MTFHPLRNEGSAELGGKHKQHAGQPLLNPLTGKGPEATLGIPEATPQDIDNSQGYAGMSGQKRQEVCPFNPHYPGISYGLGGSGVGFILKNSHLAEHFTGAEKGDNELLP